MRSPDRYGNPRRFRARLMPGRTNRVGRMHIHFANRTLRLGEWARLLDRSCADVWHDLKRGVPIGEVLAAARLPKRNWKKVRARLKRIGL